MKTDIIKEILGGNSAIILQLLQHSFRYYYNCKYD